MHRTTHHLVAIIRTAKKLEQNQQNEATKDGKCQPFLVPDDCNMGISATAFVNMVVLLPSFYANPNAGIPTQKQ